MLHIIDKLDKDGNRIVEIVTQDINKINYYINQGSPVINEYIDGIMYYHRVQKKKEDINSDVNTRTIFGFKIKSMAKLVDFLKDKGYTYLSDDGDKVFNIHMLKQRLNDALSQTRIVIENPSLSMHLSDKFLGISFDSWNKIFCTCYAQALLDSDGNINIDEICRRLKQG